MEIKDVRADDLKGNLVETKADFQEYELTDRQESNTASIQYEGVSGITSVLAL